MFATPKISFEIDGGEKCLDVSGRIMDLWTSVINVARPLMVVFHKFEMFILKKTF